MLHFKHAQDFIGHFPHLQLYLANVHLLDAIMVNTDKDVALGDIEGHELYPVEHFRSERRTKRFVHFEEPVQWQILHLAYILALGHQGVNNLVVLVLGAFIWKRVLLCADIHKNNPQLPK